jgi:hypothetical protein
MKFLPLLLLVAPAFAQTDRIELVSDKPGRAEARVSGIVLHADQATLSREREELQMRGHVHVLLPARADHTALRYGTGVIVTDQPIGLTADRVTVKNGLLLEAAGNIMVLPVDEKLKSMQLHGDELSMLLKIGDATLRGNVKITGFVPNRRASGPDFPPDIIK